MNNVIYHDFRRQPVDPKEPRLWPVIVGLILGLFIFVFAVRMAVASTPPKCWAVKVGESVSSYHFRLHGDCERMRLAIIASVCENIPAFPKEMHRAECYDQGPPKVRCVPVEDPVCKEPS